MITLQPVSTSDGRAFYDMLQRIRPENGFENSAFTMDYADFPAWLAKRVDMSQGVGLEDWQVPATTYWLMDNGVPVGTSSPMPSGRPEATSAMPWTTPSGAGATARPCCTCCWRRPGAGG